MLEMETQATKQLLASSTISNSNGSDKMNYALQVALQTMKERCIQLQRRVSNIEDENQRLREGVGSTVFNSCNLKKVDSIEDVLSLRSQINVLQRQKEQLEDQIFMVSNENRRLWSRLSKISKDQPKTTNDMELSVSPHIRSTTTMTSGTNPNLIRSKTFTQHSPNPHLRQKMITEVSLEEIPLDDFDSDEVELGYPCELIVENRSTMLDLDTNVDAKFCMEGLQDLRREAMKQQQELNSILLHLQNLTANQSCNSCLQKAESKPEMADKSLETDDRNEPKKYNDYLSQSDDTDIAHLTAQLIPAPRLNILQDKIKADAMDKTCPMCGKLYSAQISFKAFQEHVEMHFIDDDSLDVEGSIDRQYEFISHAVGDF